MEWGLLGWMELMTIIGALKTMLRDQCHVTPYGKLHGQIWECQGTLWELTVPMERPTQLNALTRELTHPVDCNPCRKV